jgi:para-nitrobenzyl esterase
MRFERSAIGMAAIYALAVPAGPVSAETATVQLDGGKLQGRRAGDLFIFKGIPYAAPPIMDRRWKEPVPAEPWTGVRSADAFGPACIQPNVEEDAGGDSGPHSEDCLFLNVWTPSLKSAPLPVIVWIHGGAYRIGSGSLGVYDGSRMAKKGIVFVTFNYRLGPLGFLDDRTPSKSSGDQIYNLGLADQVAVLKWIKKNIAAFGGDAKNVTIMGQSSGATSVLAHFASPLSKGLFSKGIALSPYWYPSDIKNDLRVSANLFKAIGSPLTGAKAETFADIDTPPAPIVGDRMLPQSIEDTFMQGKEAGLPLILTTTSDDGSVFKEFAPPGMDPFSNPGPFEVAWPLYWGMSKPAFVHALFRDMIFSENAEQIVLQHSKMAPTWQGYFDYVAEYRRTSDRFGVPHGDDIRFFLDNLKAHRSTPTDVARASAASDYVAGFARTGVPHAAAQSIWPRISSGEGARLVIGAKGIRSEPNYKPSSLIRLLRNQLARFAKQ